MRDAPSEGTVRATLARATTRPSAVAMNDAPDVRQPDPGPFKFRLAMQSRKNSEQLVNVTHVEPDAIVADKVN